ncbi:photosystem I reaction center subunit X [Myxacorys almedinensis]|uniref:Photosystem I reaction center subunit X n=1 Tax=Myxacorys almedinensis A TaxID=2690445 RepID=A0A8J7Z5I1_9CYAN|nr:photosystem I reaction center subunit X [Myxacorys almedinensis]NDJ18473.1 photosystem I reaction center subunit X [Myxacorys almedinensis A]
MLTLFAATFPEAPSSALFNWQGTPLIIGSCLLVLFIASRTIKYPQVGARMPLPFSKSLFNNISVAGFLASMSFGHVIGFLLTLAIANTGLK